MQHTPDSLESRAIGAYLGLAVGDALGATTEFLSPREIQSQHGVHDAIRGGGWLHLKAGEVTDDTQMSLALGQSILDHRGVRAAAIAEAFSQWMRGKPVDIGHTVRRGIIRYRTSGETQVPENEYDAGNGACMRALPIALYCWNAPDDVMVAASRTQSHTTHNNPMADAGTETVLRMIIAGLRGEGRAAMQTLALGLADSYPQYRYDKRRAENPSGFIVETLQVVFQAFFEHDDLASILIDVVNRGGDADTTGAIAGMLAGACYGQQAIPGRWLRKLNPRVKAACRQQALDLLALAESRQGAA